MLNTNFGHVNLGAGVRTAVGAEFALSDVQGACNPVGATGKVGPLKKQKEICKLLFKTAIIGPMDSGKQGLIQKYVDNVFPTILPSRILPDFKIKHHTYKSLDVKIQIWIVTYGTRQLWHNSTTSAYMRHTPACLITCNLNEPDIPSVKMTIEKMREINPSPYLLLIGTKKDLLEGTQKNDEEIRQLAATYKIEYMATSAKYNDNVSEAFDKIKIFLCEEYIHTNLTGRIY